MELFATFYLTHLIKSFAEQALLLQQLYQPHLIWLLEVLPIMGINLAVF